MMTIHNLISLLGIFALMAVAWIFSKDRGNINWRVGITALLLSFLGLLSMANWFISILGQAIGKVLGISLELSLQKILSLAYYPFSILMGVSVSDAPVKVKGTVLISI